MDKSLYDMIEECVNCNDKALQKYLLEQLRIRIYGGNTKESDKIKIKKKGVK